MGATNTSNRGSKMNCTTILRDPRYVAFALLVSGTLAGCGGASGSTVAPPQSAESAPAVKAGAATERVLYTFGGLPQKDGQEPDGAVIADSSGNLYGTTLVGGLKSFFCGSGGCG